MDLSRFQFSVIYGIDVVVRRLAALDEGLSDLTPPDYNKRGWRCTDRGPCEYAYLGGNWKRGRHRKHATILSFEHFCDFIEHCGLSVEKVKTLGSFGAPGCGPGVSPAVPFQAEWQTAIVCCYVTPIPPEDMLPDPNQLLLPGVETPMLDFDEVEQTMWEWFEDGAWSAREAEEIRETEENHTIS